MSNLKLSAGLLLGVLCGCGETKSLGDNFGGASSLGGNVSQGGSSANVNGGGPMGFGGQSSGGARTTLPYPLSPTLPVPAACECETTNSVCNAERVCVPRCTEGGECAAWRVERGVLDMRPEDGALYILLQPKRDMFGNPVEGADAASSLWAVTDTRAAPQRVANLSGNDVAVRILGRSGSSTVVLGIKTVWTVSDGGLVSALEIPSTWRSVALAADSLYAISPSGLVTRGLEPNSAPVTLLEHAFSEEALQTGIASLHAGRTVWMRVYDTLCRFDPSSPADTGCATIDPAWDPFFAASDDYIYRMSFAYQTVVRYRRDGSIDKTLFRGDSSSQLMNEPQLAAGWVYVLMGDESGGRSFVRFPADRVAAPTPIIAADVLAAARAPQPGVSVEGNAFQFAADANALYWVQLLADYTSADANVARYVFRAPLPAD